MLGNMIDFGATLLLVGRRHNGARFPVTVGLKLESPWSMVHAEGSVVVSSFSYLVSSSDVVSSSAGCQGRVRQLNDVRRGHRVAERTDM